jgi:serine phosphatase RsbU (regulator of sigma subunit)
VLDRLNRLLLDEGSARPFITLIHGEIYTVPPAPASSVGSPGSLGASTASAGIRISVVCAGHPLPLVMRAAEGGTASPAVEPQPLLGVIDQLTFSAQEFVLFPGDLLLCVTDGVTERRDDVGHLLDDNDGLAKLLSDCRDLSAGGVAARIQRAVTDYGPGLPSDDMALLVFRALP